MSRAAVISVSVLYACASFACLCVQAVLVGEGRMHCALGAALLQPGGAAQSDPLAPSIPCPRPPVLQARWTCPAMAACGRCSVAPMASTWRWCGKRTAPPSWWTSAPMGRLPGSCQVSPALGAALLLSSPPAATWLHRAPRLCPRHGQNLRPPPSHPQLFTTHTLAHTLTHALNPEPHMHAGLEAAFPHDIALGAAPIALTGAGDRLFAAYVAPLCETCGPLQRFVLFPPHFDLGEGAVMDEEEAEAQLEEAATASGGLSTVDPETVAAVHDHAMAHAHDHAASGTPPLPLLPKEALTAAGCECVGQPDCGCEAQANEQFEAQLQALEVRAQNLRVCY